MWEIWYFAQLPVEHWGRPGEHRMHRLCPLPYQALGQAPQIAFRYKYGGKTSQNPTKKFKIILKITVVFNVWHVLLLPESSNFQIWLFSPQKFRETLGVGLHGENGYLLFLWEFINALLLHKISLYSNRMCVLPLFEGPRQAGQADVELLKDIFLSGRERNTDCQTFNKNHN